MSGNPTQRGAIILVAMIVVIALCAIFNFSVLPSMGTSVGVPVITVPGEAYNGQLPSENVNFTNTLMATLLADAMVLIFLFFALRASKRWSSEVPSRFQSIVELIGGFIYGQTKGFAGDRPLARNWLFPLAASIFVFLLAANWMKLLPGIESVGILHCAHEGSNGYPSIKVGNEAYQLYVDQPLYAGQTATHDDYTNCHHFLDAREHLTPSQTALNGAAAELEIAEAALAQDTTLTDAEREAALEEARLHATELVYDHPTFPLTSDEIRKGVLPYVTVVTPFVRGAATDLNLTLGLALVTFFAIQIFGVAAQGPSYFQKFINLRALGTLQKNPLGAVDFVVGIFEIVSEIGKVVSLAFRLFGNMFAGGILLAVMSFLVAFLLPMVFIGLEIVITSVQAFVFAVLTIVFVAQAMEGHHHDDEAHHEEGGTAAIEPERDMPIERNAV